jgi:hypothetical protein
MVRTLTLCGLLLAALAVDAAQKQQQLKRR